MPGKIRVDVQPVGYSEIRWGQRLVILKGDNMEKIVEKASKFSEKAHAGQVRKYTKLPYIVHPASVAWLVKKYKKSKNIDFLVAAALLHDVVEDCGVSIETLEQEFGPMVSSLVEELSNDKSVTDVGTEETIGYMVGKLLTISSYALTIKLCDILHNLNDTEPGSELQISFAKKTKIFIDNIERFRKLTATQALIVEEIKKSYD